MRKFLFSTIILTATFAACQKMPSSVQEPVEGQEIVFNLNGDGIDFNVQTKTSVVSSVSSVFWQINNGSTPVAAVGSNPTSVSSNKVSTGYYWPSSSATYTFYVSNVTFNSSSKAITATNATDIVCGSATETSLTSAGTNVSVTLDHIFARTGSLTLNAPSGYSVSVSKWEIKSSGSATGTAGTYTIGGSWGSTATTELARQEFTGSSDLYLIPGTYTVWVTYTISKSPGYSETLTKSSTVTLQQGKVNSISATAPNGSATEIKFNVSVTAWGSVTLNPTFS